MPTRSLRGSARRFAAAFALVGAALDAGAEPDFSGVWGMVQHDRLGAPFFIPIEPKLNAEGTATGLITQLDQSILPRVAELSF